jgi:hypothetical protein
MSLDKFTGVHLPRQRNFLPFVIFLSFSLKNLRAKNNYFGVFLRFSLIKKSSCNFLEVRITASPLLRIVEINFYIYVNEEPECLKAKL